MFPSMVRGTGLSRMTRPGAAALALAALLGAAVGTGAAMVGGGGGQPGASSSETTVGGDATTTTVAQSRFWTAVIASVEARKKDARAQADKVVNEAAAKGQEAFVLDGRAYDGLNDAYLAVCVGRFDDQAAAVERIAQLKALGYKPYPRDVGNLSAGAQSGDQGGGDQG
jgi:hypothetical protein